VKELANNTAARDSIPTSTNLRLFTFKLTSQIPGTDENGYENAS
jgi:hypothetical protein